MIPEISNPLRRGACNRATSSPFFKRFRCGSTPREGFGESPGRVANDTSVARFEARGAATMVLVVAGAGKIEKKKVMSKLFPPRPRVTTKSAGSYAIVASKFNEEYVQALVDNAHRELNELDPGANIVLVWTPGSFEIPLFVQATAALKRFQAVLALGVVIEGETAHATLIAEAVTRALMDLSLLHRLPVIHEVLLVKDVAQARARCMGMEHNRGVEAARAAVTASRKLPEIL